MSFKLLTIALMVKTAVEWIVWDVFLGTNGAPLESSMIKEAGWSCTAFGFSVGYLLGHWFFNRDQARISGWGYSLPVITALVIFDLLWWKLGQNPKPWFRDPALWLSVGIVLGNWFWPQPI